MTKRSKTKAPGKVLIFNEKNFDAIFAKVIDAMMSEAQARCGVRLRVLTPYLSPDEVTRRVNAEFGVVGPDRMCARAVEHALNRRQREGELEAMPVLREMVENSPSSSLQELVNIATVFPLAKGIKKPRLRALFVEVHTLVKALDQVEGKRGRK